MHSVRARRADAAVTAESIHIFSVGVIHAPLVSPFDVLCLIPGVSGLKEELLDVFQQFW